MLKELEKEKSYQQNAEMLEDHAKLLQQEDAEENNTKMDANSNSVAKHIEETDKYFIEDVKELEEHVHQELKENVDQEKLVDAVLEVAVNSDSISEKVFGEN